MDTLHEHMMITKGHEYLLAIGVLALFVLFWSYLNRGQAALPQAVRALKLEDLRLGRRMFYHPGHTWLKRAMIGGSMVGVDDFIDKLAGDLHGVKVPATGTLVKRGEPVFALELGSRTLHIPAPISGKVTMINPRMYQQSYHPQLGTLSKNWLVRLEPTNWQAEMGELQPMISGREWLKSEVDRFRQFLNTQIEKPGVATVSLADGGDPVFGVLRHLDDEGLQQFEEEFLKT